MQAPGGMPGQIDHVHAVYAVGQVKGQNPDGVKTRDNRLRTGHDGEKQEKNKQDGNLFFHRTESFHCRSSGSIQASHAARGRLSRMILARIFRSEAGINS